MNAILLTVACGLIVAGIFFMLVGSIGLIRLPEFYARSHAASKADTLGIMLLLAGLAVYEGFTLIAGKLLIGVFFVMLSNPVAIHAFARAALRLGEKPKRTAEPARPIPKDS